MVREMNGSQGLAESPEGLFAQAERSGWISAEDLVEWVAEQVEERGIEVRQLSHPEGTNGELEGHLKE